MGAGGSCTQIDTAVDRLMMPRLKRRPQDLFVQEHVAPRAISSASTEGSRLSIRVVIATKGRPAAVGELLHCLNQQSRLPDAIVVVGTCAADLPRLKAWSEVPFVSLVSSLPGLTVQRNLGVVHLRRHRPVDNGVIVFFDDDFRPHSGWLQQCEWAFEGHPSVVGVTGRVLADGIATQQIEETTAAQLLAGVELPPHLIETSPIGTLYGCNMAVRETMFGRHSFCEDLPNYGWLEDLDFSGQICRSGDLIKVTTCVGVHLGVVDARMDPRQLGYSQIANPLWLRRRRTISRLDCVRILVRRTLAPAVKSLGSERAQEYRSRLVGVAIAYLHLVQGRLHPMAITEMDDRSRVCRRTDDGALAETSGEVVSPNR